MSVTDAIQVSPAGEADEKRWNALLAKAFNGSWRLNMGFQKARENSRRSLSAFIFSSGGEDIAAALYTLNIAAAGMLRVAGIRHGIIFRQESDTAILPRIVDHFTQWAVKQKAVFSTIAPWLPMVSEGRQTDIYTYAGNILSRHGYSPVAGGMNTYLIDLTLAEDELLARMNRSTRKLVRRGPRSRLRVEVLSSPDDQLLKTLWIMYHDLSARKNFGSLDMKLFCTRTRALCSGGQAVVFLTYCGDTIVSFTLVSLTGIPAGMYGAVNPAFREEDDCISPGPPSVWAIISYLRERGYNYYDMGFCPGPVPVSDHPEYSVWLFKYNFGPLHLRYMPVYGRVLKPLTGRVFRLLKYGKEKLE